MLINFQQSVREYNFLRVRNWLTGEIPHVDLLAIIASDGPGDRASKLRSELRMANYGPISVKGRRENWKNGFLIPHISREKAAQMAGTHDQRFVIWGQKKTDSFIFEHVFCPARKTVASRVVRIIRPVAGAAVPIRGQRVPLRFLENAESSGDFYIPYVDEVTIGVMPEVTNAEDAAWVSEADLPKTERVQQLLESVRRYEPGLSEEHGLKDSWQYRGMLLIALKELETLARW